MNKQRNRCIKVNRGDSKQCVWMSYRRVAKSLLSWACVSLRQLCQESVHHSMGSDLWMPHPEISFTTGKQRLQLERLNLSPWFWTLEVDYETCMLWEHPQPCQPHSLPETQKPPSSLWSGMLWFKESYQNHTLHRHVNTPTNCANPREKGPSLHSACSLLFPVFRRT